MIKNKVPSLLILLILYGCAFTGTEIGKNQRAYSNFFLCFPDMDSGFSSLSLEKQLIVRKEIAEEKRIRNFDCKEFSNFVSSKQNVDNINKEIFRDKTQPCRRPNLSNCEPR